MNFLKVSKKDNNLLNINIEKSPDICSMICPTLKHHSQPQQLIQNVAWPLANCPCCGFARSSTPREVSFTPWVCVLAKLWNIASAYLLCETASAEADEIISTGPFGHILTFKIPTGGREGNGRGGGRKQSQTNFYFVHTNGFLSFASVFERRRHCHVPTSSDSPTVSSLSSTVSSFTTGQHIVELWLGTDRTTDDAPMSEQWLIFRWGLSPCHWLLTTACSRHSNQAAVRF